jgi:predicted phosphodiesterase
MKKKYNSDEEIIQYCIQNPSSTRREVARAMNCGNSRAQNILHSVRLSETKDKEIISANVRFKGETQKLKDVSRVKDKVFREHIRIENAILVANEEIKRILGKYNLSKITRVHDVKGQNAVAIVHLSDLHLNELVYIDGNTFDFDVASRKLKQFATRCKSYLLPLKIKNILIANTGDILNSDRRLDEYLSQASNRMNATMLAVYLLEQFIVDLNQEFNVKIAQVVGNESRAKDEPGYNEVVASDNYDYMIFNILRHSLRSAKGIHFILGNPQELVISVAGQNVLMLHGQQLRANIESSIQQIRGKYAENGKVIDFIIFGDIHSTRIGDTYARSSSLVGGNAYSFSGLQLASRSAQNIYILYGNGNRDCIKVDLQNIDEKTVGYKIIDELKAYNAKSAGKLHPNATIVEIVI